MKQLLQILIQSNTISDMLLYDFIIYYMRCDVIIPCMKKMEKILEENNGNVRFSSQIHEFILDENMELKAVKLKNGIEVDHEGLHRFFAPKHPLIKTPQGMKETLDSFFVHEFVDRRAIH